MDGYRSSMCFYLKGGGSRKKKNKYLFLNYYELEGDFGEGNGTPLQYSGLEEPGGLQSMGSLRVGHD